MIVGFTGTREGMTHNQKKNFLYWIKNNEVEQFHHGDCVGADKEANDMICYSKLIIEIHIHPPIRTENRAYCSGFHYDPKGYIERDRAIVDACDILIACPKTKEEEIRSGTWTTVRYAKKKLKPIIIMEP